MLLLCSATSVIPFVVGRYRLPMIPIVLLFAASALLWLYNERKKITGLRLVSITFIVLFTSYCHADDLKRVIVPVINPHGYLEKFSNNTCVIHDGFNGSKPVGPYKGKISHGQKAIKLLNLHQRFVTGSQPEFLCWLMFKGKGQVSVTINGELFPIDPLPGPEGKLRLFRLRFPKRYLKKIMNFCVEPAPGTVLYIAVGDGISFDRSFRLDQHDKLINFPLDSITPTYNHTAHLPRGEWQAGLLIKGSCNNE